jgi:hypothetical protein
MGRTALQKARAPTTFANCHPHSPPILGSSTLKPTLKLRAVTGLPSLN